MTRADGQPGGMTEDQLRAAIAEREPARNEQRGHVLLDYLLQRGTDDLAGGLRAALIGEPDTLLAAKAGGQMPFWSAKARQLDLLVLLLSGLIADLEKRDLYPLWTSGGPDFDRSVARALWQLAGAKEPSNAEDQPRSMMRSLWKLTGAKEPLKPGDQPPAQAVAMAEVIGRFVQIARNVQNREGGYRHAYPGELIGESHDSLKLKRAGKESWIAFIGPLLDPRTFERIPRDKLLDLAFESLGFDQDDPRLLLYFKDADGWMAYNQRFGLGTLRDAVVAGLERATRRAGLTAALGTKPADTLNGVLYALEQGTKETFDPQARKRLQDILSGLAPIWPGHLAAHIEREITVPLLEGLEDLGSALFSEREDLPAFGAAVSFEGTTLFTAIDEQLRAFISGAGITAAQGKMDFALSVAIFSTAFIAALADRLVALDNPPGRSAELLRQFLKLNVTHWWTEAARRASHMALSAFIGEKMRKSFSEIDPAFAASLSQYGLDAGKWDAARANFGVLLLSAPVSETILNDARSGMDAWLDDRMIVASLGIEEAGHARFGRGVTDFTAEGELLRFLAQFRLFRAPFLPKAHGTADVREADRAIHKAMAEGDGLPALSSLLIWTVLFARLRAFGVELLNGEEPTGADDEGEDNDEDADNDEDGDDDENVGDEENAPDDASWLDAAKTGGALGLCADLLFGDTTGLKSTPLSSLSEIDHPAIASALRIWRQARNGDDVRAALAEWAQQQGSALDRLQVTRQALNYALLHQLQDMMSPGYLPRTVKDMQARAANAYWRMPGAGDLSDGGGKLN
jgi:hypothetical protein